jgi:lysine-specific demethylase 8
MRTIPVSDRTQFAFWYALHCHFPASQGVARRKDAVRRRVVRRLQAQGARRPIPIDRVRDISPAEFKRRYVRTGRPVIIEGVAADWTCSRRWTFDFLRDYCGDELIKITQREGVTTEARVGNKEYSHEMPFREYVDQLLNHGKTYLRFSSLLEAFPELLKDLDLAYLKSLRPSSRTGAWVQAFIGGKGTKTPYHAAITSGIFVNISGRKRWQLIPSHYNPIVYPSERPVEIVHTTVDAWAPDLDAYPGFDCIDRIEAIQEPGDLLYFPPWMWHYVENLDHTIGLRYGFATLRDALVGSLGLTYVRGVAAKPSLLSNALITFTRRDIRNREDRLLAPAVIDD